MPRGVNSRTLLLNRLVSRSRTRAPEEHERHAPTHSVGDLLEILEARRAAGVAFEHIGSIAPGTEAEDESEALGRSLIRLARFNAQDVNGRRYYTLLIEHIDQSARTFPVVDLRTFEGRELAGRADDRGSTAAHLMVRMPTADEEETGFERCVIEQVSPITRIEIQTFMARQLRRTAKDQEWNFSIGVQNRRTGRVEQKSYLYHSRLELHADIGRGIGVDEDGNSILNHMIFSKRNERQATGSGTDDQQDEFLADVELKVYARQGPTEAGALSAWLQRLRRDYESRGYSTRLCFRSAGGGTFSGPVDQALAGATDLLMCPRATIELDEEPKKWRSEICSDTVAKMRRILDTDRLWERR